MNSSNSRSFSTLLCLPAPDVNALGSGRSVCAITALFLRPGQKFLLCPIGKLDSTDHVEWCYRESFHQDAKQSLNAWKYDPPEIAYWAVCEQSLIFNIDAQMVALEALSIWQKDWLVAKLNSSKNIFITVLRVYRLVTPFNLPAEIITDEKIGRFLSLHEPYEKMQSRPVLSDSIFNHRKQQLESLSSPEYPDLEALQGQIAKYAQIDPRARDFEHGLKVFLGWTNSYDMIEQVPEWIQEISTSGNSSEGDLFEKRVRQAFTYLGFTNTLNNPKISLDPAAAGGAGGIDFYCEAPYPIVGECKASKSSRVNDNKDGAPFQLIKLGQKYLESEGFNNAIKIIVAPGEFTKDANQTAIGNQMNVILPETLQRLVELKSAHPGAVDLLELKPYLEKAPFGTDANARINEFIDLIWLRIKIRAHIIQLVKNHQQTTKDEDVEIGPLYGAYVYSNPPKALTSEELKEILIELASPLAGYLGRVQGTDRFYFLRELQIS